MGYSPGRGPISEFWALTARGEGASSLPAAAVVGWRSPCARPARLAANFRYSGAARRVSDLCYWSAEELLWIRRRTIRIKAT